MISSRSGIYSLLYKSVNSVLFPHPLFAVYCISRQSHYMYFEQDCVDGSDETDCSHACTAKDGVDVEMPVDCFSGCHVDNCTCNETYFQCHTGGCVPASKLCDYSSDCADGSDELLCNFPVCLNDTHTTCDNGQCILYGRKCDRTKDCLDGSDEKGNSSLVILLKWHAYALNYMVLYWLRRDKIAESQLYENIHTIFTFHIKHEISGEARPSCSAITFKS